MYSNDMVVNCPHCLADISVSRLTRMTECSFCGKKFNIEDGKKAREIEMNKKSILSDAPDNQTRSKEADDSQVSEKAKFCQECGRKLAFDARFCDWCGTKI